MHTATPEDLWRIAETGDTPDLEATLAAGVEIDASNSHGMTALMRAADHGQIEMVRLLLNHGADPNRARNDGFTSLLLAAFFGHVEIVKILVEHGADIHAATFGATAQQWAATRTFQDVVHYLDNTGVVQKLSIEGVVEHRKLQALEEANSATVKTLDELPNQQEAYENIPHAGAMGSLQPLYRRRVVYALATLVLAVGLFAGLTLGNKQHPNVVSTQTPAPIVIDPVVVTTKAESLPEAKPVQPSDAKVETLAFSNGVNNSYKKRDKVNTSPALLVARGAPSTRNSSGRNISERRNGASGVSQPPPSPGEPKDVNNAELPVAATDRAKPTPAISREPTPKRRSEPVTTLLLSPTRSANKGRVIQWP